MISLILSRHKCIFSILNAITDIFPSSPPPRSGNALCVVERAPQSSELLRRRQMEEEDDVYMAKVAEQVR
jgi:hypothetical protein